MSFKAKSPGILHYVYTCLFRNDMTSCHLSADRRRGGRIRGQIECVADAYVSICGMYEKPCDVFEWAMGRGQVLDLDDLRDDRNDARIDSTISI